MSIDSGLFWEVSSSKIPLFFSSLLYYYTYYYILYIYIIYIYIYTHYYTIIHRIIHINIFHYNYQQIIKRESFEIEVGCPLRRDSRVQRVKITLTKQAITGTNIEFDEKENYDHLYGNMGTPRGVTNDISRFINSVDDSWRGKKHFLRTWRRSGELTVKLLGKY